MGGWRGGDLWPAVNCTFRAHPLPFTNPMLPCNDIILKVRMGCIGHERVYVCIKRRVGNVGETSKSKLDFESIHLK